MNESQVTFHVESSWDGKEWGSEAGKSEEEATRSLFTLNWIEPDMLWRIVKVVDGKIVATGIAVWDEKQKIVKWS